MCVLFFFIVELCFLGCKTSVYYPVACLGLCPSGFIVCACYKVVGRLCTTVPS